MLGNLVHFDSIRDPAADTFDSIHDPAADYLAV